MNDLPATVYKIIPFGLCEFAIMDGVRLDTNPVLYSWSYYDVGLSAAGAVGLMYSLEWCENDRH